MTAGVYVQKQFVSKNLILNGVFLKVAIASDHAGVEQKRELIEHMKSNDIEVVDLGPNDALSVDYPDFALKVGNQVSNRLCDFGILVCGTGIGMAISANKIKGIRAANVTSHKFAKLAREHNDANVLTLSARFVDINENIKCVNEFLGAKFEGGRHQQRVDKIRKLEDL